MTASLQTLILLTLSNVIMTSCPAHQAECTGTGPCVLFIAFELPVDAVASDVRTF